MLGTRHEILQQFRTPEYVPHPRFPGVDTFAFLATWPAAPLVFSLPLFTVEVRRLEYLHAPAGGPIAAHPLRFQQDGYRLWYQVDGTGVLQNLTQSFFGRAAPGLLGVMDSGHRLSYLHQRGTFECILLDFVLRPGPRAYCYWNSAIEGKKVLGENERAHFEYQAFSLLRTIGNGEDPQGMRTAAYVAEILSGVFDGELLQIRNEHFPSDKPRSLVAMARAHMDANYGSLHHQRALQQTCGVDINYLNILFKRETGVTLYRYLTKVRMEHAKHLLEADRASVVDIASAVGYPNSNSFSRAFRRSIGMSPSEYVSRQSGAKATGLSPAQHAAQPIT